MVNRKDPASPDMIKNLVEGSNLDNLLELRNMCIFFLAFVGVFRIEEGLHIKYKDIAFHDGYMTINIDVSKTDQLRKGNQVVILESVNSANTCPVRFLRRYLSRLHRFPLESLHYVFWSLSKTRLGHTVVSSNKPITYSAIREYFKICFKDTVPDIAVFSTHSLRVGGATIAANEGVPNRLFQRHGR